MDIDALKAQAYQFLADSFGGSLNPELGQAAKEYVSNLKNRTTQLTNNPAGYIDERMRAQLAPFAKAVDWKRNGLDAVTGSSNTRNSIANDEVNAAMGMVGPSAMGQIVYHGTPHNFDKFDMSKIGTGEGAQAYGHGLYLAESQDVAIAYRDSVGQTKAHVSKYLRDGKSDAEIIKHIRTLDNVDLKTAKKTLSEVKKAPSALYKADIPDDELPNFIDWDKPLKLQSQALTKIKESGLLNNYLAEANATRNRSNESNPARLTHPVLGKIANRQIDIENMSGSSVLSAITQVFKGDSTKASEYLKSIGIPGIRYLDEQSRAAGGTSNFVLFDDQMPRILEVNGKPTGLQPWQPGEYKGLP